jgi:hypothetical protein
MKTHFVVGLLITGLSVAGCAQVVGDKPLESPSPQTQLSNEQAMEQFATIAKASCDKALEIGVVEQSAGDTGFTLVMVPKSASYKDFSAAYFEPTDTFELIWEIDALSACGASMQFDLAAEAGVQVDLSVEFDAATGNFETTQDFGEYGISQLSYEHKDGLFTGVRTSGEEDGDFRTITYGLTSQDRVILETAVDRFLAEQ